MTQDTIDTFELHLLWDIFDTLTPKLKDYAM